VDPNPLGSETFFGPGCRSEITWQVGFGGGSTLKNHQYRRKAKRIVKNYLMKIDL
jgi:hypothetical protein